MSSHREERSFPLLVKRLIDLKHCYPSIFTSLQRSIICITPSEMLDIIVTLCTSHGYSGSAISDDTLHTFDLENRRFRTRHEKDCSSNEDKKTQPRLSGMIRARAR